MPNVLHADETIETQLASALRRIRQLEKRPGGGGVTGAGGFYTLHSYDIPLGTSTDIDTGWTSWFNEADSGLSLVSGIPTYAPGVYHTTVELEVSWAADGFQVDPHTIELAEAVVGNNIQVVNGNSGFYWKWQSWAWLTDPTTACALAVEYHTGPSGSTSDMFLSGTYLRTLRLGDMP